MKHRVAITSTVIRTYEVDADDEDQAIEAVHELMRVGGEDEEDAIVEIDDYTIDVTITNLEEEE